MICDRYPPEARSVAHLFEDLAEALGTRDHDVCVLTKWPVDLGSPSSTEPPVVMRKERRGTVRVVRCRGLFGSKRAVWVRALDQVFVGLAIGLRILRLPRFDVILVYSPPILLALASSLAGKVRRVPCVLNLHDIYPRTAIELGVLRNRWLIALAESVESFIYRQVAAVIVPAPGSRRFLIENKQVESSKVHLVYNWVDTRVVVPGPQANRFSKAHGLVGAFVVSYAGLMGRAQDLGSVVECARLLRDQRDILFVLVGDGLLAGMWHERARDLSNVLFFPTVDKDEYLDVLRASEVCLMPLTRELTSPAIPGKLQNIMAVGKPVIAVVPTGSDAAQAVEACECGIVVEPGAAEALSEAVMTLRDDVRLRATLGARGREFAERHFDLAIARESIEDVISRAQAAGERL